MAWVSRSFSCGSPKISHQFPLPMSSLGVAFFHPSGGGSFQAGGVGRRPVDSWGLRRGSPRAQSSASATRRRTMLAEPSYAGHRVLSVRFRGMMRLIRAPPAAAGLRHLWCCLAICATTGWPSQSESGGFRMTASLVSQPGDNFETVAEVASDRHVRRRSLPLSRRRQPGCPGPEDQRIRRNDERPRAPLR